jgi:hypothetical protein
LALSNSSRVPTTYSFGFFNGNKLQDTRRGEANFVNYPGTPTNQLGNEVGNPTIVAGQVTWASNQTGYTGTGILKGAAMGQPLMLHAEALFLLAEAQLRGHIAGDYITTFNLGVNAAFNYSFKNENEGLVTPPGLTWAPIHWRRHLVTNTVQPTQETLLLTLRLQEHSRTDWKRSSRRNILQ